MTTQLERIEALAAGLQGIVTGTSYGRPALKIGGKAIICVRDEDTLVLTRPLPEKELLMEMAPEIYFETDHYRGWPAVLIHAQAIGDDELRGRIAEGWRRLAPKKLQKPSPAS